jgi:hypothetical protein
MTGLLIASLVAVAVAAAIILAPAAISMRRDRS